MAAVYSVLVDHIHATWPAWVFIAGAAALKLEALDVHEGKAD